MRGPQRQHTGHTTGYVNPCLFVLHGTESNRLLLCLNRIAHSWMASTVHSLSNCIQYVATAPHVSGSPCDRLCDKLATEKKGKAVWRYTSWQERSRSVENLSSKRSCSCRYAVADCSCTSSPGTAGAGGYGRLKWVNVDVTAWMCQKLKCQLFRATLLLVGTGYLSEIFVVTVKASEMLSNT